MRGSHHCVHFTRFTTVLSPFNFLGTNIQTRVPDYVYKAQFVKMSANAPFCRDVFRDSVSETCSLEYTQKLALLKDKWGNVHSFTFPLR